MKIDQLNLFFPTILKIGQQHIQSINWESWIRNPDNQRYYLLARSYASGLNWVAKINSEHSSALSYPHKIMEYDSYQQFFQQNEIDSCISPIKYEHTYLTTNGAVQHNLFYALKNTEGEYQNISPTKAEVKAKANPQDSTKYSPVLTIQLLPNAEIAEIGSMITLPQRFKSTNNDDEKAIANLNLALQANKSASPDAALLLQALMIEICLQNCREITPEFDLVLAKLVENKAQPQSSFRISSNQIRLMHSLFFHSKGWWTWIWEKGKLNPIFEPAITSKLAII